MVDDPPAPEDMPTEDAADEIERDDDKLSSTMESPIDATERDAATSSSPPPKRPKTIPPRPQSERPPAPLPTPAKAPLSTKSAPPKAPSRPPPGSSSSRPPPKGNGSATPDEIDLDGPTTVMDSDEVDAALASAPIEVPAVHEVDPADFAKTLRIQRKTPSGAPDAGAPPGIPSLANTDDDAGKKKKGGSKRRKSRKGKRRMVKIPDDSVPATPTPPAVGAAGTDAGNDAADDAADDHGDSEPEAPASEDPDFDSRATMVMEAPSEAAEGATDDGALEAIEEIEPEPASESSPTPDADDDEEDDEDEDDEEDAPERTSGIFTDEQSIGVVRPIEVTNQLPPVESALDSSGQPSARRPPPPRRSDRPNQTDEIEEIEEIIPDRMSLPSMSADAANAIADGEFGQVKSARRPLPPPRSAMASDPNLLLETPIETTGVTHPTGLDAMTNLSAEAAAAEAAAREAEEIARKAEARAKEAEVRAAEAAKKKSKPPRKPWWMDWFHGDFLMTMDNPKKKDVSRETTFIEESLRLEPGSRVLDLCCGHGVHAVELASRGYQLVGVDVSQDMLAFANEYNNKRNTAVSFIQGDMRELNLDRVFDGIYCWSSSFGYFDEQRNIDVLERVARALRPGGRFALDVTNRDYVAPRSPSMAWFEKPGCVCMDEMKFDFYTSRMITKRMVMFDSGKSKEMESSIRLYTLHELGRLLHKVGFKVLEVSGHRAHRGAYFGVESPRIIVVSERRETDKA